MSKRSNKPLALVGIIIGTISLLAAGLISTSVLTVFEVLTQQGTIYCTYRFDQAGTRK